MIPYGTDAPIYHYPVGTGLMIVTTIVCFAVHGPIDVGHPWILEFGTFPHPLQWVSTMFAHDGLMHLIGNMYFLAVFGFIVEGKIGWWRFIRLYLGIGITAAALTQLIMWPFPGPGAVGASAAIMGLMTICLVWAPKNELSVFMIILYRAFLFEISILMYGMLYLVFELISLMLTGFRMSTPALHLIGAGVGFAAGAVYVRRGWVDCENWDLFAVLSGTYGRFGDSATTVGSHANPALLFGKDVDVSEIMVSDRAVGDADRSGPDMATIRQLIQQSRYMEASDALFTLQLGHSNDRLEEPLLKRLARGLLAADAVDEAEFFLEEYVRRFPDTADWCRVALAQIQLQRRCRPRAALSLLRKVRLSQLTDGQKKTAKRIVARAKQAIRAGVKDRGDEYAQGGD